MKQPDRPENTFATKWKPERRADAGDDTCQHNLIIFYSESSYHHVLLQALLCNIINNFDCEHVVRFRPQMALINVSMRAGLPPNIPVIDIWGKQISKTKSSISENMSGYILEILYLLNKWFWHHLCQKKKMTYNRFIQNMTHNKTGISWLQSLSQPLLHHDSSHTNVLLVIVNMWNPAAINHLVFKKPIYINTWLISGLSVY